MLGIGFGSGGSRTTIAIDRGEGPITPEGNECGESISDARSDQSRIAAMEWISQRIRAQEERELCAWIGAVGFSGASVATVQEEFRPLVQALERNGRSVDLFIANDAVSLLKAPPMNGTGIIAVVGTGSVVMGTHPDCLEGVIRRGGFEWLVSDEGSGVWMTLESVRVILDEIREGGLLDNDSPLLDRLCDYFRVDSEYVSSVPHQYRAFARADLVARIVAKTDSGSKRRLAGFVYPHLFDLADNRPGKPHDPLAAKVLARSVRIITRHIDEVSKELAAHTADQMSARWLPPVVVAGNIATNPQYETRLRSAVAECKSVGPVETVGDSALQLASLAYRYLTLSRAEQRALAQSFDPLHAVVKLL
jgi:N-acetylglucosamine kinase-like BadF-type ATPase